jgi:hypothetical protein
MAIEPLTQDDINAQIESIKADFDRRMAEMEKRHAQELSDVRSASNPQSTGLIPYHGGGPGLSMRATWSAYEQDLCNRGEWVEPEQNV